MISNTRSFKAFVHAEILPPNQVILFDEQNSRHLLEGEVYSSIATYLSKGTYSTDQIIEDLSEKFSAPDVYYALFRLEKKGLLEETNSELPKDIQSFCNLLEVPCSLGAEHLKNTIVSVKAFGSASIDLLKSSLESMSIIVDEQKMPSFTIAVTDNYRNTELRNFLLHLKSPYLLIKSTRSEIWIGPLFNPGKGACLDCLIEALKGNSCEELFIEHQTKRTSAFTVPTGTFPTMNSVACNLAANEIFKWIVQGKNQSLESKILSYHFLQPIITSHLVTKKAHCSNCGVPPTAEPVSFELYSQMKSFTEDGGHRIKSPEETYKKYEHLISPITGIIEYLIPNHPDQLSLMHTYQAGHRMQASHFESCQIDKNIRAKSGGKGKSEVQGKTSCLCEAIERYSGIYQGNERKIRSSYQLLKNRAIHPDSLLLFSQQQYEIREEWNKTCSNLHIIPSPFNNEEEIEWTPVWSLTENRHKYIPTAICYYSYPFGKGNAFCRGDSNGSAAGNTKEEAILQGFFELVERDSIALWWYSRIRRPEVDLKSFPDPHINRLITAYQSINRKLWVIDITMDLNIPTFAAISCKDDSVQGEILFGFGSHFDPSIALSRALTEMNQPLRFLNIENSEQQIDPKQQVIQNWIKNEILRNHSYLIPEETLKKKQRSDYHRFDTNDIKEDILVCQKIVEEKGLELLVLDQTRVDIELPVVKVFVPGLRHFWNRYASGRLYDVPVQLGLVKQKLKEEELNPIPFFF